MAWTSPNQEKPKDQDPWTGGSKKKPKQSPPLLEDLVKDLFKSLLNNSKNSDDGKKPTFNISAKVWLRVLGAAVIAAWCAAGIHVLNDQQEGLVFRLGVYQKTLGTGWHWQPFGIDQVKLFDRTQSINESLTTDVLSSDSNLANITIKLTYHVNNPKNYFLRFDNSQAVLKKVAASVLQQTTAESKLDEILDDSKDSKFSQALQQNLTQALAQQSLGIQLDQVEITSVAVPDTVKEVFSKIDALYDEQNKEEQAAAEYEKQILPPAQVKANQMISDAKAYAVQVKLKAQEEVADFLAELPVYQKAPALTRYRLYSETMQNILSKTTKVVVDEKAGAPAIYLPANSPDTNAAPSDNTSTPSTTDATTTNTPSNNDAYDSATSSMYGNVQGGY